MKKGLLLLNLGTPDSPEPADVKRYLREFLMDPYVIDIPWPARWFLVNALVIPRRKVDSSALYKKVWMPEGSPLLVYSQRLLPKVQASLGQEYEVRLAMRYGRPTIAQTLAELDRAGVKSLTVLPLYPQYSLAATASSEQKVRALCLEHGYSFGLNFVQPFYNQPAYLDAVAEVSRPYLRRHLHDLVIFSFHGLPERQVKKTDPSKTYCLVDPKCCEQETQANQKCYRHQCYVTARELAQRLNINPLRYVVAFQSRLGRTPWIQPFTDEFYRTLPGRGIKRLVVLSPSFVADCLETVEEIQIRGKEEFLRSGGTELTLVPSLNDSQVWAEAVAQITRAANN